MEVIEYARFQITSVEFRSLSRSLIFFEPPDISKQKSFPSPQLTTVILVIPDFSKYLFFFNQFSFPLEVGK